MNLVLAGVVGKSGEAVKSGPIGLAVILILCIACYFLFKSMSKHLRTVREEFPSDATEDAAGQQSAGQLTEATEAQRVEVQRVADADQPVERPAPDA